MNPSSPELPSTPHASDDGGVDNRSYARNVSDNHLATLDEEENPVAKLPLQVTSPTSLVFPAIYEVSTDEKMMSPTRPPPSASSTGSGHQQNRRGTGLGPKERQLSILDPTTDRVSTILVWKNLTVQARENKRKEFFQRMKPYKDFEPKRKNLLSNTSGAITGGLWAVMGKLFFFSCIHR
jgi:hypothetical protein